MKYAQLLSDHVYDWSDRSFRKILGRVAQAAAIVAAKTSTVGCGAAGLADRALQALWQAGLQMCGGPRPWPEVLPVGEFSRRAAADGLRAPRRRGGDPHAGRQFPRDTRGARGGLRDQSRAVTAPRGALRTGGERNLAAAQPTDRRLRRCSAPRQHGRGMARRRAAPHYTRGESR
jgi:hypothetical protein